MSLDIIIVLLVGSSIFGMGVATGAIIEFSRAKKYFGNLIYDRDKDYISHVAQLITIMHQVEDRLKIVQKESKYNLQEARKTRDICEEAFMPSVTQEIQVKTENDTPILDLREIDL